MTNDAALASMDLTTRSLRLPTVKRVGPRLADEAARRHQTHLYFLAAVLLCETDDRDENHGNSPDAIIEIPHPMRATVGH